MKIFLETTLEQLKQIEQKAIKTTSEIEKQNLALIYRRKWDNSTVPVSDMLVSVKGNKTALDLEQYLSNFITATNCAMADFFQCLCKNDNDGKVLEIKNILKENYGVKKAFLDNSSKFAERCLETAELLQSHNINMPDRIIGCSYYPKYCGISIPKTKDGATILLHSDLEGWQPCSLTNEPIEILVHEILHLQQNGFFLSNIKNLPKYYRDIAKNSAIANTSINHFHANHEAHIDLLLSKIIKNNLSDNEENLLEYLNKLFFVKEDIIL